MKEMSLLETKLRGTEVTRFHSKYQSTIDSNLQIEHPASNSSCYSSNKQFHDTLQHSYALDKPKTNFEFHCPKTAEREMVIVQTMKSIIEPELVSNMNGKTPKIKPRGNGKSKYRPISYSDLETINSASSSSFIPNGHLHDPVQHIYSVKKANSISGPHCPTTEIKRTVITKISQSNEPELDSKMNGKTHKTKLRGNEMYRFHSKYQPIINSELQTEYSASNSLFVPNGPLQNTVHQTYTIDRPNHSKTAGRGMVMKQIAESTGSLNGWLKYSNTPTPRVSSPSLHQLTVRGTRLADEQISEHIENLNLQLKNTILNFSNTYIEQHFKTLQQEKKKEQNEENEKMWGKMIQSNKKKL